MRKNKRCQRLLLGMGWSTIQWLASFILCCSHKKCHRLSVLATKTSQFYIFLKEALQSVLFNHPQLHFPVSIRCPPSLSLCRKLQYIRPMTYKVKGRCKATLEENFVSAEDWRILGEWDCEKRKCLSFSKLPASCPISCLPSYIHIQESIHTNRCMYNLPAHTHVHTYQCRPWDSIDGPWKGLSKFAWIPPF